ncbi:MAG: transglycosylase domain-containing protein, partial [Terriglobia bacterium]
MRARVRRLFRRRWKEAILAGSLVVILFTCVFLHYYVRFSEMVDERLGGDIFHRTSLVLSAPRPVVTGEEATPQELEDWLRKSLYTSGAPTGYGVGTFQVEGDRLLIYPGKESFFASGQHQEGPAAITFKGDQIVSITDLTHGSSLSPYLLEPEVITTLFGRSRSKRLIVSYSDCPKVLVDAVLAAEDRRFFSHDGVNLFRIGQAAVTDIRADRRLQGGSTITMQLARIFFLSPRRTFKRKTEQIILAMLLEHRLTKQQIFGMYANEVYMGQRGSFSIYGFGEAADTYFNKDIRDLTLPEAALLAGMIRGPNLYSPYRDPARTMDRRNEVLRLMAENHFVTRAQASQAEAAPLGVTLRNSGASEAPYFVDLVRDELVAHLPSQDLRTQSYHIYTTLDPELQTVASGGLRKGIREVDKLIASRRRKKSPPRQRNEPQAALVVLDPHTGDILALVGGRNYGASQLDHAVALRQPGSSFKPFVYAAALSSAVDGSQPLITPATVLPDQPMSFQFGNITYSPHDYKDEYYGQVTVREALALSLNVASVNLAQMIGYDKVRDLALQVGLNNGIMATPAIALGSYLVTPVQLAGAYTAFSNGGVYESPRCIVAVKDASGRTVWQEPTVSRRVLDPRVAYLMVSLMESVVNHGTGEGVRARGFLAPAAGKTGTSRDGWFAGFTSNLLAVAWVGYDNNQNLNLLGARSALPIWTDFMKAASALPSYNTMQPFVPPFGIISAPIGAQAAMATANNPLETQADLFIDGTQPVSAGAASSLTSWIKKLLPFVKHAKTPIAQAQDASRGSSGSSSAQPSAPAQRLPPA